MIHLPLLLRCLTLPALLLLAACQKPPHQPEPVAPAPQPATPKRQGQLLDYGEARLAQLALKLKGQQPVHVVQLGDSHTAADFFTGQLRNDLQQQYGNAGPGLLPPAQIRGQRSATLKLGIAAEKWQLSSSRLASEPGDWPLGGFMLSPRPESPLLQLAPYTDSMPRHNLRALYRSPAPTALKFNGQLHQLPATPLWRWSQPINLALPLAIRPAMSVPGLELGGWLLDNGQPGVMLSALGINGATARMPKRWDAHWQQQLQALQPALIILAYGSNEAFDERLDPHSYRQDLSALVQQLRAHNPDAALLLIGPPDSIRQPNADSCALRQPPQLRNAKAAIRAVARQHKTLFWDWQAFMGGHCAMQEWQANDLAQKDGVHLTRAGYERSAAALFADLQQRLANSAAYVQADPLQTSSQ